MEVTVFDKSAVALALLILAAPLPAQAMPSEVLGEGVASCGDFLAQPNMQSVRLEWVMGYISGVDSETPIPKDRMTGHSLTSGQQPFEWLQNYCNANPANPLIMAADAMRIELQERER